MTINPRDYDLDELRKMARGKSDSPRTPPTGEDADEETPPELEGWGTIEPEMGEIGEMGAPKGVLEDKFESDIHRELLPLEAGEDDLSKPYLDSLPENYAAEIVIFEWLEFLLEDFGYQGASEALQYYESVGWIADDIETALSDYLVGIEEPEGVVQDGDIDSHKLSLVYVARLVSMI
ncbi:MAG: FlaD/FlaE family flagellar protein [Halorientalis sp.]